MNDTSIFNSFWGILMVVLFFGGSIFVHELGHFLAAKWRGLHIERFSIGFGPKICSWTRGGVEYRLSWLPLGGYVALPQLADMRGIEGDSSVDHKALPPISYSSKVIVALAGAVFNILFAFLLATLLFFTGRPSSEARTSTEIGYVSETLVNAAGEEVPAPGHVAGLEEGDVIVALDGEPIKDWDDVHQHIALSSGRTDQGDRVIDFEVLRDGERLHLPVEPIISRDYKIRQVGIQSGYTVIITGLFPDSPAVEAGIEPGDVVVSLDGKRIRNFARFRALTEGRAGEEIPMTVKRGEELIHTTIVPEEVVVRRDGTTDTLTGIADWTMKTELLHQTPVEQLQEMAADTLANLGALINRNSDIGLSHMSGPAGIIRIIYSAAQYSVLQTIWITMFINVSLAFFNLLPIPVLDGGHIAFATFSKLRGKPINPNVIASLQGSFMLILFSMIIYITYFDISRWFSDSSQIAEYREQLITPVFGEDGRDVEADAPEPAQEPAHSQ